MAGRPDWRRCWRPPWWRCPWCRPITGWPRCPSLGTGCPGRRCGRAGSGCSAAGSRMSWRAARTRSARCCGWGCPGPGSRSCPAASTWSGSARTAPQPGVTPVTAWWPPGVTSARPPAWTRWSARCAGYRAPNCWSSAGHRPAGWPIIPRRAGWSRMPVRPGSPTGSGCWVRCRSSACRPCCGPRTPRCACPGTTRSARWRWRRWRAVFPWWPPRWAGWRTRWSTG
jgi:hypothetical protein